MLTQISVLTHNIGNRPFNLLCPLDSTTGDLKDALCQFLKFVGQIEDAAKAQQDQQQEPKIEEGSLPAQDHSVTE